MLEARRLRGSVNLNDTRVSSIGDAQVAGGGYLGSVIDSVISHRRSHLFVRVIILNETIWLK